MTAKLDQLNTLQHAQWSRDDDKNVLIGDRYIKIVNFLYDGDKLALFEYKSNENNQITFGALEKNLKLTDHEFEINFNKSDIHNIIKLGVEESFMTLLQLRYPYNLDNFLITSNQIIYTNSHFYILNAIKITSNFYKTVIDKLKETELDNIKNVRIVEYDEFWEKYTDTHEKIGINTNRTNLYMKVIMPLLI